MKLNGKQTPQSKNYDEYYFEHSCGGHEEFARSKGEELPPWMAYAFTLAKVNPGEKILDLGTGRGEIPYQSAKIGAHAIGLDYSSAAIKFSRALRKKSGVLNQHFELILADARQFPFTSNQFNVIFMLDIVEHLSNEDLKSILDQVYMCLQPGGRLIIHTMPNLNYYKWGYPIYRRIMRLFGNKLPMDPRMRFYRGETHINIQSPKSLQENLNKSGFENNIVRVNQLSGSWIKRLFCRLPFLRHILANDIIAIGLK